MHGYLLVMQWLDSFGMDDLGAGERSSPQLHYKRYASVTAE